MKVNMTLVGKLSNDRADQIVAGVIADAKAMAELVLAESDDNQIVGLQAFVEITVETEKK